MNSTRDRGNEAEDLAVQHLEEKGYRILERNWYSHHHELDIIAQKDGLVAIVEVRSLSKNYFQEPYQSVNRNKQRLIISAANAYIRRTGLNDEVRFDIISIITGSTPPQIEHIENAFYPQLKNYR